MAKLSRIHWHWTAGTNSVSSLDKEHYHFIIDGDGIVHNGNLKPEANQSTSDGSYMAHTRGANTGAIGIGLAGMAGAVERPFNAGKYPLNQKQIAALVELSADLAETYGIPVTRKTMLMHSEVQRTLGIKQRGKWDMNWLPGMSAPADAIQVGDGLRKLVAEVLGGDRPEGLRVGDTGVEVVGLQSLLNAGGFDAGTADGHFGPHTQAAVRAAQSANGIEATGIASEALIAALRKPQTPELQQEGPDLDALMPFIEVASNFYPALKFLPQAIRALQEVKESR